MKKRIVCFGDSNTWGYNAATKGRFGEDVRWTGVMQAALGEGYTVIEEGQNGRTTVWDDPIEQHKNGFSYLMPMMESHKPFDLIIIMLGANDLKCRFSVTARDIAKSAALLTQTAMRSDCGPGGGAPQALLVTPIPIGDGIMSTWFGEMFEADCVSRSHGFGRWFAQFAQEIGCHSLNAADFAQADPTDCLHISPKGHRALGLGMAAKAKDILNLLE